MSDRQVAATNQWPVKGGVGSGAGRFVPAKIIDHPDFAGFVTFADAGTQVAFLVDHPDHAGFVTPDSAATEATKDATPMNVGGGFVIIVGN